MAKKPPPEKIYVAVWYNRISLADETWEPHPEREIYEYKLVTPPKKRKARR